MSEDAAADREFGEAVGRLGPAVLSGVDALEKAFRYLHPPNFPVLQERLAPIRDGLAEMLPIFEQAPTPAALSEFRRDLLAGSTLTLGALTRIVEPGDDGVMGALGAMHGHARAQLGQALLVAVEHGEPDRDLVTEGDGQCVLQMSAARHRRVAVL